MALAITDDHQALADVVRSFAQSHDLRALTRQALDADPGSDPGPVWKQMADLGWLGLHLPEEHGGSGYTLSELAVVAEGLGAVVAGGPFLPTVVASAVVAEVGTAAQQAALLPGLADGSLKAGLGLAAELDGDGTLTGASGPVLGGRWADVVLLVAGDDLAVVPGSAFELAPVTSIDASLGLAAGFLTRVAPEHVLAGGARVARRLLRIVAAAEAVGGARAGLDTALAYAKVREQFGRTIGSFQAVKHHLANMLVRSELATATVWDAARAGAGGAAPSETESSGADEADLAAAVAAAQSFEAYQLNARQTIQLLGGIGFTWEHDAHLYLRRAAALAAIAGPVRAAEDDVFALAAAGVRRQFAVALPPEAEAFREAAIAFRERYQATPEEGRRQALVDTGYLVPHWGTPFGRGAGAVEQLVIEQELAEVDTPNLGIGGWVLLTLTQQASPEQIERWVMASLRGEHVWCQLFSEPGAGSDAAAVQTRGVRVDGGWRVTGQKVWTSGAQYCDRGLATIRTDPSAAKHKGITAMVIDLKAPGVEVRPLREITGDALFNEVFFDDVFVPDEDVVGEVNQGWTVARATLGNERVTIGGGSREGVSAFELIDLVRVHAPEDGGLVRDVGRSVIEEQAMQLINLRTVERAVIGAGPGPEGNVTKLLSAEHAQRVTELGMNIVALAGVTGETPELTYEYLFDRCLSIAGGTSEVTRNVIAERILGLPREVIPR